MGPDVGLHPLDDLAKSSHHSTRPKGPNATPKGPRPNKLVKRLTKLRQPPFHYSREEIGETRVPFLLGRPSLTCL